MGVRAMLDDRLLRVFACYVAAIQVKYVVFSSILYLFLSVHSSIEKWRQCIWQAVLYELSILLVIQEMPEVLLIADEDELGPGCILQNLRGTCFEEVIGWPVMLRGPKTH
jgi:hypothetical protein